MTASRVICGRVVGGLGMALALGLGCSGSSSSGDTRSGNGTTVPSKSKSSSTGSGQGGDGSGTSGSAAPGFGNSSSQPTTSNRAAADASVDGSGPDQGGCGAVEVEPMIKMTTTMTTVPGNLLLVFDKSTSMKDSWNGGSSKWLTATGAITTALTSLQDKIAKAGAVFFPNPGSCEVAAIDSGQQIDWMPIAPFLTAWSSFVAANGPNGSTPTDTAGDVADAALMRGLPMLMGTTAVVFVTDGDPTCGQTADVAIQNATKWAAMGVKTYVLGLPGTTGNGQTVLMALAVAGGTSTFILPNDPMALQTELAKIVGSSVQTMTTSAFDSCTITLPKTPPNPDDVNLVVTQMGMREKVDRDLGSGGGWTLNAAATEIVLQGLFCDFAKMGKYDKISVAFGCVDYPPLPPPRVE